MTAYQLSETERQTYRRYASLALPRHTSYPIAPAWRAEYGPPDFREDLRRSAARGGPLSLYVHVPFCERMYAGQRAADEDGAQKRHIDHRLENHPCLAGGKTGLLGEVFGGGLHFAQRRDRRPADAAGPVAHDGAFPPSREPGCPEQASRCSA